MFIFVSNVLIGSLLPTLTFCGRRLVCLLGPVISQTPITSRDNRRLSLFKIRQEKISNYRHLTLEKLVLDDLFTPYQRYKKRFLLSCNVS